MRLNWRFLFVAAAAIAVAVHPGLASASVASVPADTVRAGQCSPSFMAAPDTNAKWYRTMAAWYHEAPGAWSNDSLRTELIALEKKDQAVRQGITPDSVRDSAFVKRERVTDSANTARMRAILAVRLAREEHGRRAGCICGLHTHTAQHGTRPERARSHAGCEAG